MCSVIFPSENRNDVVFELTFDRTLEDTSQKDYGVAYGDLPHMYDYTTYNNDGNSGEPATTQFYYDGKIGYSLLLDGDSDFVDVGTGKDIGLKASSGAFSAWFKSDAETGDIMYIMAHRNGSNEMIYLHIDTNDDFTCGFGDNYQAIASNNNVAADGEWHHGIITWNSTHAECFLDGSSLGTYTYSLLNDTGIIRIGSHAEATPGDFFNGQIDEVMIFNRSLLATEVGEIYNSTFSRFHPQGNQTFRFQNFTQNGTYNRVNLTIESQQLNGTSINARLYEANIGNNTGYVESGDDGLVGYWHFDDFYKYPYISKPKDWSISTTTSGYYGDNYRTNNFGVGSEKVEYHFIIQDTGEYEVYGWHIEAGGASSDAPYTTCHDDGCTTVDINQQINGAKWDYIGRYNFTEGIKYN
jgi:hypothetical protein